METESGDALQPVFRQNFAGRDFRVNSYGSGSIRSSKVKNHYRRKKMNFMMVEKLGAVSMRGGVVRIQCMAIGADGKEQVTGELLIPAVQYGQVAGGMQAAAKQLNEKIEEARKEQEEAPAPAQ
jgi:hypothetical protein